MLMAILLISLSFLTLEVKVLGEGAYSGRVDKVTLGDHPHSPLFFRAVLKDTRSWHLLMPLFPRVQLDHSLQIQGMT